MSKERELLESCLDEMQYHNLVCPELKIDIKELLAQPEQAMLKLRESSATQTFNDAVSEELSAKPVAFKGKTYGNLHHVDYGNSIPLYTSPQTCDVVKLQNEVYQYRHKLPEDAFWSQWIECEIDYYKTYLSAPIKANIYGTLIEYQVRVLHKEPPTRKPLSDEVVRRFADAEYMVCNNAFTMGVRWAEQQHGITGVVDE